VNQDYVQVGQRVHVEFTQIVLIVLLTTDAALAFFLILFQLRMKDVNAVRDISETLKTHANLV
jgi:hypothetical protein